MIYKTKGNGLDFYIVELAINGKVIFTDKILTESRNKSGVIGFDTDQIKCINKKGWA